MLIMNNTEKAQYRRYMSLCSSGLLHEMTGDGSFTEEDKDELRTLKETLGGDHKEILQKAKSILVDDVTKS